MPKAKLQIDNNIHKANTPNLLTDYHILYNITCTGDQQLVTRW